MIYLSPYRSYLLKDKPISQTHEDLILWRVQMGSKEPYAKIYHNKLHQTYRYEIKDNHSRGSFISIKYTIHLLDVALQKSNCVLLSSEDKFSKLEVLK